MNARIDSGLGGGLPSARQYLVCLGLSLLAVACTQADSGPMGDQEGGADAAPHDSTAADSGGPDGALDAGAVDAGADAVVDDGAVDSWIEAGVDAEPSDAAVDATADSGVAAVRWTEVHAVIGARCTGCHDSTPTGNLDMSSKATAYTNLVGVPAAGSACGGSGTRVVAGDALSSILYQKVAPSVAQCGSAMPLGGAALSAGDIARFETWINAGALDD